MYVSTHLIFLIFLIILCLVMPAIWGDIFDPLVHYLENGPTKEQKKARKAQQEKDAYLDWAIKQHLN